MRSDALDIILEGRADATWLILSGPFHKEQIPNIRGKFASLLEDGNRYFIVDLERVTAIDDTVAQMFLAILNDVRGKGGVLKLVFKNETVSNAFAPYQNIFPIFPDASLLMSSGFFGRLIRRGKVLSKKTGVRISRQVALILLVLLSGWFFTLLFIIYLQNHRITEQEKELSELTQWKQHSSIELSALRERIRPLEQLGILRDTVKE
jgi:anti-anti-sigma regulatory factor